MGVTQTMVENIKKLLQQKGWSQRELARATGLTAPTISDILRGKKQNIRISTLEKIAKGLGCHPGDLLR